VSTQAETTVIALNIARQVQAKIFQKNRFKIGSGKDISNFKNM